MSYYYGGPDGQKGICGHCKRLPTPEGHDGCMGTLPRSAVMNACCGHGNPSNAYVQFWWDNESCDARITGKRAMAYIDANRGKQGPLCQVDSCSVCSKCGHDQFSVSNVMRRSDDFGIMASSGLISKWRETKLTCIMCGNVTISDPPEGVKV